MPSMGARRVDRSRLSGLNLAPSGGPRVPPRVVLGLTRFDGHRSSGFAPGTMSDDRGAGVGEAGRAGRGELIDLQAWPAAPWPGRRSWNTSPGTWWQSQQDDRGGWEVLPPSAGAAGASGRWSTPAQGGGMAVGPSGPVARSCTWFGEDGRRCFTGRHLVDRHHDLAVGESLADVPQRFRHLVEPERAIDVDADVARDAEVGQRGEVRWPLGHHEHPHVATG
jgi:hypothetical protein